MEEKLESTLLACTTPDTATIRQAEETLQKLLRGKGSVPLLVKLVRGSQHVSVRQLGAVLLRVKLAMHWIKLSPQEQDFCKKTLLESLLQEHVRPVRLCICYAIASLARHQFTGGPNGWPDLLEVIKRATTDMQQPENRELGYLLMYTLTETIGTSLRSSLKDLALTFTEALKTEKDPRVYSTVLRASASMIEFLNEEEDVMLFQPLVGLLLDALNKGDFGQDDFSVNAAVQVVEVLSELSESPLPVLDPFIVPCCTVLSMLTSTTTVNASIRSAAASALSDILENKARLVSKNPDAYRAALHACLSLCRETAHQSSNNADEDLLDDDEVSIKDMTEMVVTAYSNSLSTKLVVETLLNSAASMIQNEANQIDREAGLIVLIVASQGIAAELVESHANAFDHLVHMVLDCIVRTNQSVGTTRHALILLSQWAEYLWPLMEPHAGKILPACVRLSNTYHDQIFPAANMVLQQFCGAMEEDEIAPFVDDICLTAMNLFAPERKKTPRLVQSAIETLSYASIAAGSRFAPHFDKCIHITSPLMNLVGEEYSEVRAHATALMGQLAVVSKACTPSGSSNPFLMFVPELLGKCLESLERPDVADLDYRDSVHHLFANVGIALGVEIEPFLPKIVPILIHDCISDENDVLRKVVDRDGGVAQIPGSLKAIAAEEADDDMSSADEEDEGEDEEDDSVGNKKVLTSVREAAADSKASAFSALESLCDVFALSELSNDIVSKTTLVSHLEDLIHVCSVTIDEYLHPAVRANAVGALGSAILLALKAEVPTTSVSPSKDALAHYAISTLKDADFDLKWLPGVSVAHLAPRTKQLMEETVLPYLLECMTCDPSKQVAAKACETMDRIAQLTGCTLLESSAKPIIETLVILLNGEAQCQGEDDRLGSRANRHDEDGAGDNEDDDDDDEDRRHDEVLVDSIVEALANVAKALGTQTFAPLLSLTLPVLIKRGKPKMPLRDRVDAVGCLSQVVSVARSVENKFGNKIVNLAVDAIKQDEDTCLRRNGLVLLGSLVEIGDKHLVPVSALTLLKPVFDRHSTSTKQRKWEVEDDLAVLDNACSLIARVLRYGNIQEELKVRVLTDFLPYLPLKFDHEEDWIVYATLGSIAETCDVNILGMMLKVCSQAIDDVSGKGSAPALIHLFEIVVSRLGTNNMAPELLQKLAVKKQELSLRFTQ